jgi:hypothetical protein
MAEQTTVHHWINTAIATVAFVASGASAYFSFTANKLSEETAAQARENIGISSRLTLKCPFVSTPVPDHIGVCWKVTFFNRSTQPSEISDLTFSYQNKDELKPNSILDYSILSMILSNNEKPSVTLPIPVPGRGHARAVIQVM